MGVSPSSANIGKGGELPDLSKPQYYSRPRSGGEEAGMILNVRGKSNLTLSFYIAPPKGKLFKGTPFGYLKTSVEDKAKI
jgi:hypothetical protein